LVLHTIPPPRPTKTSDEEVKNGDKNDADVTMGSAPEPPDSGTSSTLPPSLLATPKLISVVEMIKREYMARLNARKTGKGKNKAVGIWQYTKSGNLDDVERRTNGIVLITVLEGKTKYVIYTAISSVLSSNC